MKNVPSFADPKKRRNTKDVLCSVAMTFEK
jgi:hypothetical protein